MAFGLKCATLKTIAQSKLDDADLLLQHHRFSNAYYLAGYAVEISLKAVIAKRFEAETIPDRNFVTALYTHEPPKLINLSGLKGQLDAADDNFKAHWAIVCEWKPDIRYESSDAISAQIMLNSTREVMKWIKAYW